MFTIFSPCTILLDPQKNLCYLFADIESVVKYSRDNIDKAKLFEDELERDRRVSQSSWVHEI